MRRIAWAIAPDTGRNLYIRWTKIHLSQDGKLTLCGKVKPSCVFDEEEGTETEGLSYCLRCELINRKAALAKAKGEEHGN